MQDLTFPTWQAPYHAALSESDLKKIVERVDAAEAAIFRRLRALRYPPENYVELCALDAALTNLVILRNETKHLLYWKPDSLETSADLSYPPN